MTPATFYRRRRFETWAVAIAYAALQVSMTGRRYRVQRERYTCGDLWTVQVTA